MTSYYDADLSGQLPDYAVIGKVLTLHRQGQVIEFNTPVFEDGLIIVTTGTPGILLDQGVDWEITASDIDDNALAEVLNIDPSFNKRLIRSLTIKRAFAPSETLQVALSYHRLYPTALSSAVFDGQMIELTPAVLMELMERMASYEQAKKTVSNATADTSAAPKLLAEDPQMANPANWVADEPYTINSFDRKNIIRPVNGSFFLDGLILKIPLQNRTLVRGVDYLPVAANLAKTATCDVAGGVYDAIQITTPYAGEVTVSAHYWGGVVTVADAQALNAQLTNLRQFLEGTEFLTTSSLITSKVIDGLFGRVKKVEDSVRLLLTNGDANYQDATTGRAYRRRFRADDANLHWWTIAKLFQVQGATDIITADRMRLRLRCAESGLQADVAITVDLSKPDPLRVESSNVLQDLGYTPFGSTSPLPVVMPQFRILWNQDVSATSGILLQIGLALPSLTETMVLEDMSGLQSCWLLQVGETAGPVLPQDTAITLPDGQSTWDVAGAYSRQSRHMMPNATGYLAWAGSQSIASMGVGDTPVVLEHLLPKEFNVADAKMLLVDLVDAANGEATRVEVPLIGQSDAVRSGRATLPVFKGIGVDNTPYYIHRGLRASLNRVDAATINLSLRVESATANDSTLVMRYVLVKL